MCGARSGFLTHASYIGSALGTRKYVWSVLHPSWSCVSAVSELERVAGAQKSGMSYDCCVFIPPRLLFDHALSARTRSRIQHTACVGRYNAGGFTNAARARRPRLLTCMLAVPPAPKMMSDVGGAMELLEKGVSVDPTSVVRVWLANMGMLVRLTTLVDVHFFTFRYVLGSTSCSHAGVRWHISYLFLS